VFDDADRTQELPLLTIQACGLAGDFHNAAMLSNEPYCLVMLSPHRSPAFMHMLPRQLPFVRVKQRRVMRAD